MFLLLESTAPPEAKPAAVSSGAIADNEEKDGNNIRYNRYYYCWVLFIMMGGATTASLFLRAFASTQKILRLGGCHFYTKFV